MGQYKFNKMTLTGVGGTYEFSVAEGSDVQLQIGDRFAGSGRMRTLSDVSEDVLDITIETRSDSEARDRSLYNR